MNFARKHRRLTSLLLLGLVLVLTLGCVNVEAAPNWMLTSYKSITDGTNEYYAEGNALHKKSNGKDTVLTKWNLSKDEHLSVISGYKSNIYIYVHHPVESENDYGLSNSYLYFGDAYSVNYKTGKKVKVISSFFPMTSYGPYIYGITDTHFSGPHPIYIWKASGNKMKKIGKVGDSLYQEPLIVNKKLYYGMFEDPDTGSMTVYRSNLNGTGRKKLFTMEPPSPDAILSVVGVAKNKITVTANTLDGFITYEYNMKTGKLSRVS